MVEPVVFLKTTRVVQWNSDFRSGVSFLKSVLLTGNCSGMPGWILGGTKTPWFSDMFSTNAFPWSFLIFIILSYEIESPRPELFTTCLFMYMYSKPYQKRCFNHFSEILFGKCHVLYLSVTFTCFNDLCNVFNMIVDWFFFFRIVPTVCFGPVMIHLNNDDNETGRSNPEKLPSNFQFWCFSIWLRIFFTASKIVLKSSELFLYVSMVFGWQSMRHVGGLENTTPGTVSFKSLFRCCL